MGLSSSVCGSEVGDYNKDGAHPPGRPPLHSRITGEEAARPPDNQPYRGNSNMSYFRGYNRGCTVTDGSRGYSEPLPLTSTASPPSYDSLGINPGHGPRRTTVNDPVATAVRARPAVVDDPGDFWLNSELSEDEEDAFDIGDDVDDFDKPPDGHLVFTSHKDYEAYRAEFVSTSNGELFEDPDFTAEPASLYGDDTPNDNRAVKWMRPHELRNNPSLIVDGFSRHDVVQGTLGDCWFLAPLSAVAKMPVLIKKVVPSDQSFTDGYTGMFRFRFWRFGRWVSVVIDDRLPTRRGKLIYAESSDPDEFWPSLIEKAYAKLHGSYQGLSGGMAADAFVDLTGGLAEVYDLHGTNNPDDIFGILYRGTRSGAFVCCSRKGDWRANEMRSLGIVTGHSYSVHRVQTGYLKAGGNVRLVQLRNPWANSNEWKGKWSDSSELWSQLKNRGDFESNEERSFSDGEFWMSYKDFLSEFTKVVISTVGPDFDGDGIPDVVNDTARGFHLVTRTGRWTKGVNAGGCVMHRERGFPSNPQIMISLLEPDEWNAASGSSSQTRGKCAIIVTLLQEYRRIRSKKKKACKKHQIGFIVYRVSDTERPLARRFFMYTESVGDSADFVNHREIVARFVLEPGHYCVIPSTFEPDITRRFMMRIFTEKPILCNALQTGLENG